MSTELPPPDLRLPAVEHTTSVVVAGRNQPIEPVIRLRLFTTGGRARYAHLTERELLALANNALQVLAQAEDHRVARSAR